MFLSFSQFSAGAETTIGSEILVAGLTYVAGTNLNVHAQISGTSPTTLNARVWAASGTSEPGTWQVSRTDSTAGLQVAGGVGLRAYTSGDHDEHADHGLIRQLHRRPDQPVALGPNA